MRVLRWSPLLLLLLVPALAHAATFNVNATSADTFVQSALTVTAGDRVTFTNTGGRHDVHFDGDAPLTATPTTNANLGSRTFTTPGTYHYVCDVHIASAGMQGTITVNPAPVASSTPTATPSPGTTPVPGATPTATPAPGASVTPTSTPQPGGAATPSVALGQVARKVRKGRVRGAITVAPSGRSYTVALLVRGKRAGRASGTSTGDAQRFAIRLSKPARRQLARKHKLKLTVLVRSGDLSARRTVTVR